MAKTGPEIEIIELAIARELDAFQLYMHMADHSHDSQMKDVLKGFAREELEHKARLELELMKLGRTVKTSKRPPAVDDLQEDKEPVENVFDMDYKDLVLFAIKKERASLRLYIDLAALAKDKVQREMFITLAEDEAMHETRFEVEYNVIMRKHG
jgi:rubrerythrin